MDKKITIEWKHLDKEGNTCNRCSNTGRELGKVIERLNKECGGKKIKVIFKETKLTAKEIAESNEVLINGVKIEDILPKARASESYCSSCCKFTGKETNCRAIEVDNVFYETISANLVRNAVCKIAQCC